MSEAMDFPLQFAQQYAGKYLPDVLKHSNKAMVVGSVRRCKPVVHDLEFLISPIMEPRFNLFGSQIEPASAFEDNYKILAHDWKASIKKDGPKYKKILLSEGISLDIFISDEARWGVETVIRTGPAEFSKKCVTLRRYGGYLPSNCRISNGWQLYRNEKLIPMPTEEDFLDFLGLAWIDPQNRR